MKHNVITLLGIVLCQGALNAEQDTLTTTELEIPLDISAIIAEKISIDDEAVDQLAPLRALVAQQAEQICHILTTLRETAQASNIDHKEQLCRELGLVCECMKTMCETIATMNKQALTHLIELNGIVLTQLQEQLIEGNLQGLCNFTAAQFTTPKQQVRSFITIEQLHEKAARMQEQIQEVWSLVTAASLATYAQAKEQAPSFWSNNKQAIVLSLSAALAAGVVYKNYPNIDTKLWIERVINYSLMALYVLRQKKDADIKPLAERWFGEDTFLANAMMNAKHYVGSPKEKLPAVHITARKDMTAAEQIAWAEANNCAVLKIEKGRDYNVVKDFFDLEDGLFKVPVAFFFAYQIKKDMNALAISLDAGAQGFFARLAELISKSK